MKQLLYWTLAVSVFNLSILSCGHMVPNSGEKSEVAKSSISRETSSKTSVEAIRKKLSKLVEAAKKTGESSVSYLADDLYLKASAAQMKGDYSTANLLYEYIVQLTPDSFVKKQYAIALIKDGELAKSKDYLREVYSESDSKKDKVRVGLVLAGVHSALNELADARNIYNTILKMDRKNEDACVFLSKSYALEEKFSKAKNTLIKCQKYHKSGIYSYYIGKLYVDKGNNKKAASYFRKSLKLDSDFSRSALAIGLIYEEEGKTKKAISHYKNFLKKNKNDELILNRLVQVMFTSETDYSQIIPYAERLTDLDSDNLNLKVKLGILYTDSKDYMKALRIFRELHMVAPKSDKILYYMGAISQEVKDFENAITYFQMIPDTSALFQDSSVQISNMLSAMAKSDRKVQDRFLAFVDKSIKKIPGLEIELKVIKASFFEAVSEPKLAVSILKEVQDKEKFSNNHRYYFAQLLEKVKKFDMAKEQVKRILAQDPNDAYAWNFLGYSLIDRGVDMDDALVYIKKATELKPKDGYIMDSFGWYYFKKGEYYKALAKLKKAHKLAPDDSTITLHVAQTYKKIKQFEEAKTFYMKALKVSKKAEEKKKITQELKDIESIRIPAASTSAHK